MTTKVIPFEYQGQPVQFSTDGWINATEVASRFGKEPHEWLRLPETVTYLEAMAKSGKIPDLVKTRRGRKGGTWLHPKLAVAFARWLSPDFAVWCDEQIDHLIRGGGQQWQQARSDLSLVHSLLCEAVQQHYEVQGRTAQQHHYVNESRLINRVIALMFGVRTREQLTQDELKQVARIEARDIQLLAQGVSYEDRKTALKALAQKQLGGQLHG